MEITNMNVAFLKEYEKNPRRNEKAVDAVAASIQEFGFKVPIIVDREGVIVAGHTRLKAAKKLGMDTVPCIIADDLTDEQIRAFRLADNRTAELAEWDPELLMQELSEITIDMEAFGFLPEEQIEDPEDIVEDEYQEPDRIKVRCKLGDIWKLGEHILVCGNSAKMEDQLKLFSDGAPKMVFTDPPYGVAVGSKNKAINEVEPGRGGK